MSIISIKPSVVPIDAAQDQRAGRSLGGTENLAGFDLIRAVAAVIVVAFHGFVPYLEHSMPGLVWSITDQPSAIADKAFWSIAVFIMPLFFVVAGFFAYRSLRSRGPSGLIKSRSKRLLRPLIFASCVILPIDLYIWVFGWVTEGLVSPSKLRTLKFKGGIDKDLWGSAHLWFIQYLFTYVLIVAAVAKLKERFASSTGGNVVALCKALHRFPAKAGVVFLVAVLAIWMRPEAIWGFQHSFVPVPSKWLFNGCFFMLGMLIAEHDPMAIRVSKLPNTSIALSGCCLLASVSLGMWSLDSEHGQQSLASSTLLALITTVTAALVSLTIMSQSLRHTMRLPKSLQYLAAASFWIYLVHQPILGIVHIDLKQMTLGMPPAIKGVSATVIATTLSLCTYELLVRKTKFGGWMGMNFSFQEDHPATSQDQRESIKSFVEMAAKDNLPPSTIEATPDDRFRRAA